MIKQIKYIKSTLFYPFISPLLAMYTAGFDFKASVSSVGDETEELRLADTKKKKDKND